MIVNWPGCCFCDNSSHTLLTDVGPKKVRKVPVKAKRSRQIALSVKSSICRSSRRRSEADATLAWSISSGMCFSGSEAGCFVSDTACVGNIACFVDIIALSVTCAGMKVQLAKYARSVAYQKACCIVTALAVLLRIRWKSELNTFEGDCLMRLVQFSKAKQECTCGDDG